MPNIETKDIIIDKLYAVSDLFNPCDVDLTDKRYIHLGNHIVVITGKALKEELAAGVKLSYISDRIYCGNTFDAVRNELETLIRAVKDRGIDAPKVDYSDSLSRLIKEKERATK